MSRLRASHIAAMVVGILLSFVALMLLWRSRPADPSPSAGRPPWTADGAAPPPLLPGPTRLGPPHRIAADPLKDAATGGAVGGRVVDDEDGQPIGGAGVAIVLDVAIRHAPATAWALSRDDGTFEIPNPIPSNGAIQVTALGYRTEQVHSPVGADIEIRLKRGSRIRGRVLNEVGEPVVGAVVYAVTGSNRCCWPLSTLLVDTAPGGGGGMDAATDQDGVFEVAGLDVSKQYGVFARAEAHTDDGRGEPTWVQAPSDGVAIVLRRITTLNLFVSIVHLGGVTRAATGATSVSLKMPPGYDFVGYQGLASAPDLWGMASDSAPSAVIRMASAPWPRERAGEVDSHTVRLVGSVRVVGVGHANFDVRCPVGSTLDQRIDVNVRARGVSLTPVALSVALPSGEGVTGHLVGELDILGTRQGVGLRVEGGRAAETLLLPSGRATLTVWGGLGRETAAWFPRRRDTIELIVPEQTTVFELPVVLQADKLELTVVDANGSVVRGYDLRVEWSEPGVEMPWIRAWDSAGAGPFAWGASPQVLYVPGGELRLRVNLAGVGGGVALVKANGAGEVLPVTVRINPSEEIRLEPPPRLR